MAERPSGSVRRPVPATDRAPSVGALQFLLDAANSTWLPPLLVAGWTMLAVLLTQFPQRLAPMLTSDGLTVSDFRAMAALGLAELGDSMVLWLLAAMTIVLLVARAVARPRTDPDTDAKRSAQTAIEVEANLQRALSRTPLGRWTAVRSTQTDTGRQLRIGWQTQARWLGLIGAGLVVGSLVTLQRSPPPVWLEIPITAKRTRIPLQATTAGPGRHVPARGYFEGACSESGGALLCDLEGFGKRGSVSLRPGKSAFLNGSMLTWTHSATAIEGDSWNLRWWLDGPDGQARWYALDTRSGQHATAKSLGVSVTASATSRSGPVVAGAIGTTQPRAVIAAGPGLLPGGQPLVRAGSGGHALVLWSHVDVRWGILSGLGLLLVALLLGWGLPAADVVIAHGVVRHVHANRPGLTLDLAGPSA